MALAWGEDLVAMTSTWVGARNSFPVELEVSSSHCLEGVAKAVRDGGSGSALGGEGCGLRWRTSFNPMAVRKRKGRGVVGD